ncbi:MAG: hypothetical protein SYNGOMJ08_00595 [Candidatus Syntrophoarchaeum sp. GoM_oil]|nr:MAG: hypothetical protein SYNGOMJ08_00595 [Candidatus Syntrophoarchaeum sp. GoM_oil]
MNLKWKISVLIVALAMVLGIGVPLVSAAPVVVDGNSQSFAGEWTAADQLELDTGLMLDPQADAGIDEDENIYGYDLKALYQKYDLATDTLYFMIEVYGMPGDLNGDDDPDDPSGCGGGGIGDGPGVGINEQYSLTVSGSTQILYKSNTATVIPLPGTATAAHESYGANRCIEFALNDASTHVDPFDYCVHVSAGGDCDGPGEDLMDACFQEEAELDFDWVDACCKRQDFEGEVISGIFDENEWEWDFGAGATPATSTLLDPVVVVEYATCGTKTVSLTGKTVSGQTVPKTKTIYVACDPTAIAKANGHTGTLHIDPGDTVTFSGTSSHADPSAPWRSIKRYEWVIPGHGTFTTATVEDLPINSDTTATLTVWDQTTATGEEHCDGTDTVTVKVSPPEVPASTPTTIALMIGLIAVLGAAAIVIRRRD